MFDRLLAQLMQDLGLSTTGVSWDGSILPLLEENPAEAVQAALGVLLPGRIVRNEKQIVRAFQSAECPVCAVHDLGKRARPPHQAQGWQALTSLWNHTHRVDLAGRSPVESLRARLAERQDEDPWRVVVSGDDRIACCVDAGGITVVTMPQAPPAAHKALPRNALRSLPARTFSQL